MGKDSFAFKQFKVAQDRCAMKVGTDGVLLGAWAGGGCPSRCLDIGTGTGLIALMLAQRFPGAVVDAIDIDRDACRQAEENVAASPFGGRIRVSLSSLQEWQPRVAYQLIVSNPPFFVNSLKNPDNRRLTARHTDTLSYADLFRGVSRLLSDDGVFAAIIPSDFLESFVAESCISGFFVIERCGIRTTPAKPVKRWLLAFSKHRPQQLLETEQCLQNPGGERSSWYAKITDDFYL